MIPNNDADGHISIRTLAGRLEILPELVPMSSEIFTTISLVIAPEIYGGRPYDRATDAEPGSPEKLRIMERRVANGYAAISPGDNRHRHANYHADGSEPKKCWLDLMDDWE